jgi:LPS-assembly protein
MNQFDDSASRSVPIASFDTGLFFERELDIGNGSYIQTLEPRAFYLYIPERDQSDIPDFDTSLSTFNMIRLFSYDRFIGGDRIGDANQLSLAVTSRFINQTTGDEALRLTVGQIRYFDDREVTLPNRQVETDNDSDMILEAVAFINNEWSASGELQWDAGDSQTSMSSVGMRYRGEAGGIFNISHRYREEDNLTNRIEGLEQVDVSAQVPLGERWQLFGRWYRSLDQKRTLETLAGVQYDSCCWATRVALRNYVNDAFDDDRNLAIYFQIELKGLGAFGKKSDSLLERSIRGYEVD